MALHAVRHERWPDSPAIASGGTRVSARGWMLLAIAGWAAVGAVALVAAAEWRKAEQVAQLAGMTVASGRGVEITISDSRPQPVASARPLGQATKATGYTAPVPQPGQAVMTDGDLILLNMLLWYGGARAVAINNQRVTAQTTITSSGPAILINGTRIVGPFRIAALGDPDTLKGILTEAGLIEQLRSAGITVSMTAQAALRVPPWLPGADAAH